MSSDSSVRSVERAIDVLFSFTQQEPVLDIPALQQRTGLSRPTLYRLLRTLESRGLIYSFGNPLIGVNYLGRSASIILAGERRERH